VSKQLRALGNQGEALVCAELEKRDFTILERNYTSRQGEIDIIACKHNLFVFVEVKLRQQPQFALSDVINKAKQRKIIKTALYYISQNKFPSTSIYRFDVALIQNNQITYIENAFTVPE
jgi:putative endonuclease